MDLNRAWRVVSIDSDGDVIEQGVQADTREEAEAEFLAGRIYFPHRPNGGGDNRDFDELDATENILCIERWNG